MVLLLALVAAAPAAAQAASASPSGVTTYGPEFFAALRPNTALDMVQRLPGFVLDTGASVRGYEGAAGNVLIDGQRPASKTDDLGEALKRIPAGAVDHVEVIRGGAPGIDMQGKTVIANVVRKAGGGTRVLFALADIQAERVRNLPQSRLEASGRWGQVEWEAALLAALFHDDGSGDGHRLQVDPRGRALLAGDIKSYGGGSQFTVNGAAELPALGGRLRLNGRLNNQPFAYAETDRIRLPDVHTEVVEAHDNQVQSEFGARYTRPLGSAISLETVALRQDKHERQPSVYAAPGDQETFDLDARTSESIVRTVLKGQPRPRLSWEAGAEGAYNTLESHTHAAANGVAQRLPAANVTVDETRGELFGKAVWRPMDSLTLEGGLRAEASRIESGGDVVLRKTLSYTKPRILLTWEADPATQVRLRLERSVGQLDFGAFVASHSNTTGTTTAGNPNLVPEQAWVTEAAVERRFLGRGDLVLTLRHSSLTDVVDTAPFQGVDAPANIGDGTKDEAILNLTLPLERLGLSGAQLRGQSAWRWSQVTDPTTHRDREITRVRPVEWEAHFTQDLPRLRLNWGVDVFGMWRERYYRVRYVETDKLGTWVTPFVEWKPRADLSWRVELSNLTGRGFKHATDQYAGARGAAPLQFTEDRHPRFGRMLYVRLRKTWG